MNDTVLIFIKIILLEDFAFRTATGNYY